MSCCSSRLSLRFRQILTRSSCCCSSPCAQSPSRRPAAQSQRLTSAAPAVTDSTSLLLGQKLSSSEDPTLLSAARPKTHTHPPIPLDQWTMVGGADRKEGWESFSCF